MPKAKPDPALVAQARELIALGASLREAAATLGVTAPTIKRWIDAPAEPPPERPASAPPPPAELPAHMKPPEVAPLVAVDPDDPIALVKQLIREQREAIYADRASGARGQSVSSGAAVLEKLVKTLKQLEEGQRKESEGIVISAAEIARIETSLAERIRAVCNRPLLCAQCSRELSVFWGTGLTEAALNADSDANDHSKKPGDPGVV